MQKETATRIQEAIEAIQEIMIAYVTANIKTDHPEKYQNLYVELDVMLDEVGYPHPNPHKSLDGFSNYSMSNLSGFANRREYVHELYTDILIDLRRSVVRRDKSPFHWEKAAQALTGTLHPIRIQWLKAKSFIFNETPDYENSMKESIHSVESALKILLNEPKLTLGKLLNRAKHDPDIEIDLDISSIISKAYGVLSNKDSVRHGGVKAQDLSQSDAEFFLEFSAISIIYLKNKLGQKSRSD